MSRNAAIIVGSLRKESYNLKLAKALQTMAPADLSFGIVPISELPLYDEDKEAAPPEAWVKFRDSVRAADALLFVTPEYNRGIPGGLKNAIDVGSRPYGKSVWSGKPGAIISTTQGGLGAFGANHHLRQSMVFLDVPMLQQPEMYLSGIGKAFDDKGALTDEAVRKLLQNFLPAYAAWVAKILKS